LVRPVAAENLPVVAASNNLEIARIDTMPAGSHSPHWRRREVVLVR
jgi:hypothetical protein